MNFTKTKSQMAIWMAWAIASIFYAYQYILRVMPNIMITDIMDHFKIGAATFGQFSGVYYIGYSLMHLPIGILLDRFGPRKVMTGSILLTLIGLLPLIYAEHWAYPILGRFLIGIGSSGAILGVFKIIRITFSEKRFPRLLSLSVMIGLIGAIYGGKPVDSMRGVLGYQTVVQLFMAGGLILALLTYWIVPESGPTSKGSMLADVKEVLKNKKVVFSCLLAGLMVGPLEGFADVWGTAFLKEVYGFNENVAARLPSMIFIGMCFGSPVLNLIAEKIGNYLLTIIGAGLVMGASFLGMLFFPLSSMVLTISFVLVGICCAYQILAIYKASTYVREEIVGLTTSVANMIIMIFGYAIHTTIGWLITLAGGTTSSSAFVLGISVIPIALCIGCIGYISLFVREQKEKKVALSN